MKVRVVIVFPMLYRSVFPQSLSFDTHIMLLYIQVIRCESIMKMTKHINSVLILHISVSILNNHQLHNLVCEFWCFFLYCFVYLILSFVLN